MDNINLIEIIGAQQVEMVALRMRIQQLEAELQSRPASGNEAQTPEE